MSEYVKPFRELVHELDARPDSICLVGMNTTFTRSAFWANAQTVAKNWGLEGLRPGDAIAFLLPNSASLLCCYLACAIGGFVACPVLPETHPDRVDGMLKAVNARRVVDKAPKLDPTLRFEGTLAFEHPQAPYLIVFSSGSTGAPKAIVHSLEGILGSARAFARLTGMTSETRLYHVFPMAYMAGIMNAFFAPFLSGGTIIEGPPFSPAVALSFWRRPLTHHVNTLSVTPTIASALLRMTRRAETITKVGEALMQVQCTSAPLSASLQARFYTKFGVPLQNCYGMTEFGGPLTFQTREDALQLADWSVLLPEVKVRVLNDDGSLQHGDAPGELFLQTPYLMLGYLSPDGLDTPWDAKGWMTTGDLARFERGKLQLVGRKKDLIIRGGLNLSPHTIERVLECHPRVERAVVVGIPHDFWGEEVVASVTLMTGTDDLTESALLRYCEQHLGVYERPNRIRVVDALPRTAIGKVSRARLRAEITAPKREG